MLSSVYPRVDIWIVLALRLWSSPSCWVELEQPHLDQEVKATEKNKTEVPQFLTARTTPPHPKTALDLLYLWTLHEREMHSQAV